MQPTENLSSEDIRTLDLIKVMQESKPVVLTMEDMVQIPKTVKELEKAEKADKGTIEEIKTLEDVIRTNQERINELRQNLNAKLQYLSMKQKTVSIVPKTTNHIIKEEYKDITPESVLKVLTEDLVYGGGNSQIAEKLNIPNSKGVQQKIYTICKKLLSDGKLKTENRLWKAV